MNIILKDVNGGTVGQLNLQACPRIGELVVKGGKFYSVFNVLHKSSGEIWLSVAEVLNLPEAFR